MTQFILGNMCTVLPKLRPNEGDFADMWKVARDSFMQAEKYEKVRAEIQKKIDDAPNARVSRALQIRHGVIDLLVSLGIGKQPG